MLRSEETTATMTEGATPLAAPLRAVPDASVEESYGLVLGLVMKAALDRVAAFLLLLVTSPALIAIAVAVWMSSSGPVFYRQRRIGRHAREFTILKFRTMVETPAPHGEADAAWAAAELGLPAPEVSPDRCTPVGRMLRRFGFDELPQLVNVLKGDMALVGPRPERSTLAAQFERHIAGYSDRLRMRPGMTGWAQVHGLRGQTSLHERTHRDNEYIDDWSLWLDLRILARTPAALIAGARDVSRR
jgi:lipopolysaccharide/colanic/teichoic acid biosynthesis glycosyltransferase